MIPRMLYADANGEIRDDPDLFMLARAGSRLYVPDAGELIPLPRESELFLLPGRTPVGLPARGGEPTLGRGLAVAAFVAPGFALAAHPAYESRPDAPPLPLFAYGAAGYARGKFWVCATRVDSEPRQVFRDVNPARIEAGCAKILRELPRNRLAAHIINNCVRRYACPAARNFALGRHEAPLPTSRACNAACLGCISALQPDTPTKTTPQCRLDFTPTAAEIAEVMLTHARREKEKPIFSFGQGCEGEPLMNPDLLLEATVEYRREDSVKGTVHLNSNASRPDAARELFRAGLTSLRVSLNSARPDVYEAYYRPADYGFADVIKSIRVSRREGGFVSLNLLYFPGVTDTEAELEALSRLCGENGVSMIQWRNLNIDPEFYPARLNEAGARLTGESVGLNVFLAALKKRCPWLRYGYFNPWLGARARLAAPEPARR